MNLFDKLKLKAEILKKDIIAIYYAYQNPKTSIFSKILIIITLGYVLSPVDLIPDFIPVLGYLDDLVILPALIYFSIKSIPADVMKEARLRAVNQPLQLKKNMVFAAFFIILWVLIIFFIIIKVYNYSMKMKF